jgi:hypothetical protein
MVLTSRIQKLQIICEKFSVLTQKLDNNVLTYNCDKMKNVLGRRSEHLCTQVFTIFCFNLHIYIPVYIY